MTQSWQRKVSDYKEVSQRRAAWLLNPAPYSWAYPPLYHLHLTLTPFFFCIRNIIRKVDTREGQISKQRVILMVYGQFMNVSRAEKPPSVANLLCSPV